MNGTNERQAPARRGWILPALSATLAVLGAGALVAAAFAPGILAHSATDASGGGAAPATTQTGDGTGAAAPDAPASGSGSPTDADTAEAGTEQRPIADLPDPAWVARVAAAGGIPERALAAYAGASIAVATTHPGCGIGWNTLAAIGLVESEHGSLGGSALAADGTVAPTVLGIALDGTRTAAVADTDGGALDGDATWDRAVGPMQFIPSTWALVAQDGNRDGVRDINQIDDAALAAAVHLCEVGGDLTRSENWIAAVGAYNPSTDYNHRVADAADAYAALG